MNKIYIYTEENFEEYMDTKNKLEKFYVKINDGVKICSKCKWYQYEEKSTKFFMNYEKSATGGTFKKLLNYSSEVINPEDIN